MGNSSTPTPPSLMFWTDWGDRVAGVYRGYMDGTNVSCIASEGVRWPNGITADERWLYWTEAFSDRIERADFTGGRRSVLVEGLPHPYAIAVFKVSRTPSRQRGGRIEPVLSVRRTSCTGTTGPGWGSSKLPKLVPRAAS